MNGNQYDRYIYTKKSNYILFKHNDTITYHTKYLKTSSAKLRQKLLGNIKSDTTFFRFSTLFGVLFGDKYRCNV